MSPRSFAAPLLLLPLLAAADAPAILPGQWTVVSTPVELVVPGVPGFLLGMAKKTRTEKKCITPDQAAQGITALFAPKDAKTCTLQSRDVGATALRQTYACRGKEGRTVTVALAGRYDQASFAGRLTMTGDLPKGPMRVVADQKAQRSAATCKR